MEMFFVYVEDILAVPEYLDLRRSPDYIINMFIGLPKVAPANAGNAGDVGSIPGLGRSPEEGMATHSSILAWVIPRTEEPGGLQFRKS